MIDITEIRTCHSVKHDTDDHGEQSDCSKGGDGRALWEACSVGDLAEVQRLLMIPGIDLEYADEEYRRTPFYRACSCQQLAAIQVLLDDGRCDVNPVQNEGCTPLIWAVHHDEVEVVDLLLRCARVDVGVRDTDGNDVVTLACLWGHWRSLKVILDNGRADPNAVGISDPCTSLYYLSCHCASLPPQRAAKTLVTLLTEPRVIANNGGGEEYGECSCLGVATALPERLLAVKALLASGKRLQHPNESRATLLEYISKRQPQTILLTRYFVSPKLVRREVRDELGWPGHGAAALYGLLQIWRYLIAPVRGMLILNAQTRRFLTVTTGLPAELQEVVCLRVFGTAARDMLWPDDRVREIKRAAGLLAKLVRVGVAVIPQQIP